MRWGLSHAGRIWCPTTRASALWLGAVLGSFRSSDLDRAPQDGLEADEITWSATITSAEKGHQWSLAFLLLAELLMKSFQLSLIACDATISACEKCGQWEEALAVLASCPWEG
ncbi:unnamed protein product [Durusdinium trenchii]|uniref:Uncharacterized protein n=1 Tax=Durusdinium trenchii TaxID=1381693 RepID=A0ABP0SQ17_9DINO